MTEPNNTGMPTDQSAGDGGEKVAVSKAEFEAMQAAQARLQKLEGIAKQAEAQDIESYLDDLEFLANQQYAAKPPAPATPAPAATPTPTPAAGGGLSAEERALLEAADKRSAQAALETHAFRWESEQALLKPEEKTVATRQDLDRVIMRQTMAVRELAPDYGGNVYKAADALFNATAEGRKRLSERAKASVEARNNAAAGTTLPTSGPTAMPTGPTSQEEWAKIQKKLADEIAPDTQITF